MSLNYASSLSPYSNKGKCGLNEIYDTVDVIKSKCETLAKLLIESKWCVAITGAGCSTSSGIPDFRGPNGVWTLEKKGLLPEKSVSFEDALPSFTHSAIVALNKINKLNFLISQNIDGLHMRSGFPINRLAELHGNMFIEKCNKCHEKRIQNCCVKKIGLKSSGKKCSKIKSKGQCRGELYDTVLDWEDDLPAEEMKKSEANCKRADLCLCLGTTLQILPVGEYPLLTKKNNGKVVIINLQPTRMDKHSDLVINGKLDQTFEILFNIMNLKCKPNPCIEINLKLDNDADNDPMFIDVRDIIVDPEYNNVTKAEASFDSENYSNKCTKISKSEPNLILIVSGKRKTGKDYVCKKLTDIFKNLNEFISFNVITLSAHLKKVYAYEHNLDFEKLLDSSDYKENFRKDMISWSDLKRAENPTFFCEKAIENLTDNDRNGKFKFWLITDARRRTDIDYFKLNFSGKIKTIRVQAVDSVREERNWKFTPGVDDSVSECDLDSINNWDFIINNNSDSENLTEIQNICDYILKMADNTKHS